MSLYIAQSSEPRASDSDFSIEIFAASCEIQNVRIDSTSIITSVVSHPVSKNAAARVRAIRVLRRVFIRGLLSVALDKARPRPVDETGSAIVGKNTEYCEEIYRRSKATMVLTGGFAVMFALRASDVAPAVQ